MFGPTQMLSSVAKLPRLLFTCSEIFCKTFVPLFRSRIWDAPPAGTAELHRLCIFNEEGKFLNVPINRQEKTFLLFSRSGSMRGGAGGRRGQWGHQAARSSLFQKISRGFEGG